jgi:hypothetical protein
MVLLGLSTRECGTESYPIQDYFLLSYYVRYPLPYVSVFCER